MLKLRGAAEPARFYKRADAAMPTSAQLGTVMAGPADWHGSQLSRKVRKSSLAEEMAAEGQEYRKRKFAELQGEPCRRRKGKAPRHTKRRGA